MGPSGDVQIVHQGLFHSISLGSLPPPSNDSGRPIFKITNINAHKKGAGQMSDKTFKSGDERALECNVLYDEALDWLTASIKARKGGGTGAAIHVMKSLREEIVAWENSGISKKDTSIDFDIPGLDHTAYNDAQNQHNA